MKQLSRRLMMCRAIPALMMTACVQQAPGSCRHRGGPFQRNHIRPVTRTYLGSFPVFRSALWRTYVSRICQARLGACGGRPLYGQYDYMGTCLRRDVSESDDAKALAWYPASLRRLKGEKMNTTFQPITGSRLTCIRCKNLGRANRNLKKGKTNHDQTSRYFQRNSSPIR